MRQQCGWTRLASFYCAVRYIVLRVPGLIFGAFNGGFRDLWPIGCDEPSLFPKIPVASHKII
jgi:hypothetical protein